MRDFGTHRRRRLAPTLLLALLAPLPLAAAETFTATDIAMLPAPCQAWARTAMGGDRAEWKQYENVYGSDNFIHMHHYCFGFLGVNRARMEFGPDKSKRALLIQNAIGDFMYVIKAWPKDFQLQPDAHLGVGRAWQLSGQDMKAMTFYMQAISLRPDFAQAYAALSDVWLARGEKAKAREVLQQGLQNTGNDKMLERRMASLGSGSPGAAQPRAGPPLPGRTANGAPSTKSP